MGCGRGSGRRGDGDPSLNPASGSMKGSTVGHHLHDMCIRQPWQERNMMESLVLMFHTVKLSQCMLMFTHLYVKHSQQASKAAPAPHLQEAAAIPHGVLEQAVTTALGQKKDAAS